MRRLCWFLGVVFVVLSAADVAWAVYVPGLTEGINLLGDVGLEVTRGAILAAGISMAVAHFQIQRGNPVGWTIIWSICLGAVCIFLWPKLAHWGAQQLGSQF